MSHELPKAYDPSAIEQRWAEYWVREKLFHVETPATPDHDHTFTLLLPPPNVTGRLHMGHMLNQTEMDIIVRWHRMRGFHTLWLPGTDHAGIATQMMVERQLAKDGKKRTDLGREKFIERVWEWKEEYGGAILEQMKRLGASVDWERTFFTMDANLSRSVREAFVRLWEEGLIYRGAYIVNWCPRCVTAISDLETIHEETPGKLWEIRYPVIGMEGEFITVATTRPETMLGDTAVAVNPRDKRYEHLHGKKVRLPLMNREIPVILDELAQPEFGTGAVKVTPAHDPNDFQAGLRHGLEQIRVMDEHAMMNENAGLYAGHDRYEARERIVHDLQEQGFLVGTKDYTVPLGKCDRCKTIVEPRLSTQWFVAVNKEPKSGGPSMAQIARDVVEQGYVKFTPENYKTIYLNWMENIHDWCISRQLWWGHRIPAWHCAECREIVVSRDEPKQCTKCGSSHLEQDTDVLDTWFSSGLLPASPFGWPEATADARAFYPTTLLITGFDILFFWVARMIMMNAFFMWRDHSDPSCLKSAVPFENVYIHGLVRDADRQKMSKTKGNVLDPIEVINQYGTDATRFTLASMASPGTDIAFNEQRVEGYRAFANKIWNAARFMFMNVDKLAEMGVTVDAPKVCHPERSEGSLSSASGLSSFTAATLEDRWILSRFNRVAQEVDESLKAYRFDEAANRVYSFFWGEFCDWYVELIKPRMFELESDAGKQTAKTACQNTVVMFEAALRLLSPMMPFITEEIWHAIYDGKPPVESIALAPYPQPDPAQMNADAETEMAILQDLIVATRNIRAELKVEPKVKVPVEIHASTPQVREMIEHNRGALERLANVESVAFVDAAPQQSANVRSTTRFDVRVVYEQKIDKAAEGERLKKEVEKLEKERSNAERQLGNQNFLAKAPAHVVEGLKKRSGELEVLLEKAKAALGQLGC
ncbi:MAG TPA: valine--tRNA ligase [Terriglobales bacterium]|nr:valine--tRNA ligase [Terriglobales bacterium]